MRPRDFLPLILLAAVGGLFVIADRPARVTVSAPPEMADAGDEDAPVIPQGVADAAPVQVTSSSAPPPARDENAIRVMLNDGAPGTYIRDVLEQQEHWIIRWPERQAENLRVWIERTPAVQNWDTQYPLVVERSFGEWRAAGFPIAFQFVHDSTSAQIRIRWVSRFPESDGRRIGVANKTYDQNGWLVESTIRLATHDARGNPLSPQIIAGVARHEVGHALGLGHSPNETDVMYPESRTPVISAPDRATLHLLYKLPPGRMR